MISSPLWPGFQVNISELRNCKLPLSEGRVTRSDTLELTAEAYVPEGLHVLLPNRKGKKLKMVPVPLAGQVLVHRRLDAPAADPASVPVTSAVPEPPEAGPDRHPLLGVGCATQPEAESQSSSRESQSTAGAGDAIWEPPSVRVTREKPLQFE
ncbi:hypothetical protein FJT64_026049 [Amphibalanus amphitrite]|uniref:Uncharacterized protein n=1 Tax=Amphibalanus amphitrite TaxID=1232801 RepID=A0A6A4W5M7_AMPAM|nr:hypothetical protein FJT64_026049 [Amphibalanus amphitrite]